jgi:hypothetical protein
MTAEQAENNLIRIGLIPARYVLECDCCGGVAVFGLDIGVSEDVWLCREHMRNLVDVCTVALGANDDR